MIRIEAKALFIDDEHRTAVVTVITIRCIYQVAIRNSEITVVGPGVEEKYFLDEDIPLNLTREGQAMMAVILFEEDDE